ncbi:hypothetical protein MPL3365_110023 [Mesorhizobium plurifarium]|uniref:Uncharacterized protein n=1 Tax=Mesorhizobium plurifarium TaxID=69974 RepID=A0A090FUR1_MESPL|nr:hypothetical protein MPL3365_110023 [Mesorhizobium plurifarium]
MTGARIPACSRKNIPLSLGVLNPYVSAVTRGGAAALPTKSMIPKSGNRFSEKEHA